MHVVFCKQDLEVVLGAKKEELGAEEGKFAPVPSRDPDLVPLLIVAPHGTVVVSLKRYCPRKL
jgi:hypothetical protein